MSLSVKIVSQNFQIKDAHKLCVAKENGRYSSIDRAFSLTSEQIIDEIGKKTQCEHMQSGDKQEDGCDIHDCTHKIRDQQDRKG